MSVVIVLFTIAAAVAADQVIKFFISSYLMPVGVCELVPGFLRLRYVENTGAIFGSFSNYTIILTVFSVALVVATLYFILSGRVKSKYIFACLLLMSAGGIGNLVDRIRLGYVIDYFEFTFVNFAVFNFADCLITVGAGMLIAYLIVDLIKDIKHGKNKKAVPEGENNAEASVDGNTGA